MTQATQMESRTLGSRGPEISVTGYGAWEAGGMLWGPTRSEQQTVEAMRAGFDAGINWIDTAEVYGPHRSEELVGEAIEGHDAVMVFTKVHPTVEVGDMRLGSGVDAAGIRRGAEGSLKRLGRDVIDLYQLHIPSPEVAVEESWAAMAELVDDGVVRFIGVCNYDRELLERCEAVRHVDSLQVHFSLLHPQARDELFGVCERNGTGVLCYGPLGFGMLTGTIWRDTEFGPDDWRSGGFPLPVPLYETIFAPPNRERHLSVVDALRPIAQRRGVTLPQLALAWVTAHGEVSGAIVGSRSPEHARENAAAGALRLSGDDLAEIEEVTTTKAASPQP
jgi:methylglyoxal reductase